MKRAVVAIVVIAICVGIGGVGAWAFNPDSGAVAHNEALWQIFGVVSEGGLFLLVALALLLALVTLLLVPFHVVRDAVRARRPRSL